MLRKVRHPFDGNSNISTGEPREETGAKDLHDTEKAPWNVIGSDLGDKVNLERCKEEEKGAWDPDQQSQLEALGEVWIICLPCCRIL